MKYGYLEDVSGIDFQLPVAPLFSQKYLKGEKASQPSIYIGSSVWSDKDFKGNFYPEKTPQKNFLKEYSKQFNTVEVNATRYGTPRTSTLNTWKGNSPEGFKFCFKMPQIITQRKNLLALDVLERLEQFILAMDSMDGKLGTTFILLQNSFNKDRLHELRGFLEQLPVSQKFAIEVRNSNFNQSEAFCDLLHEFNISNVITDTAGERSIIHKTVTSNSAFIRFVGNGLIETDYNRINAWIDQIETWVNQGVNEFFFLHHQPNQARRLSGFAAKYMIDQINLRLPNLKIKSPHDYSSITSTEN